MHPSIYEAQSESLLTYLRARFPRVSPDVLEDAVQDCFLETLQHPSAFDAALAESERRLQGLMRCVAWRKARGRLCRGAGRFEVPAEQLPDAARLPGQPAMMDLVPRLSRALDEAATLHGGATPELLRAALLHRFLSGESDTEVARVFGLRREPLNRAKRFVQTELLA